MLPLIALLLTTTAAAAAAPAAAAAAAAAAATAPAGAAAAAATSCAVGLPWKTGVSVVNASELLVYQSLIFAEICGNPLDPNSTFAADVQAWESTGNATALLGLICKQQQHREAVGGLDTAQQLKLNRAAGRLQGSSGDDSVCRQYFEVWGGLPGWQQCKPAVRRADKMYGLSQIAGRCPPGVQ